MLMTILLFLSGFCLSSISTVYEVIGLMSIFPAAPLSIMLMGSALAISKLVIASWLYRNWSEIPKFLRTYFCIALVVLMFLTSMSIFGYLSKAHMDASLVSGESVASLQIIDEKIATQRSNIEQDKKALTQMDASVNEMMSRTTDANGISKAMHYRKSQAAERASIDKDVLAIQGVITTLQSERAPLAAAVRKSDAEVGPIKYIANLIYGDNIDNTLLEKAVRIVILMIVSVFDPLAMLILIAANWNQKHQASLPKVAKVKYETREVRDEVKAEVLNHEFANQDMIDEQPVFETIQVSESNPDDERPRIKVNDDLSWTWIDYPEDTIISDAQRLADDFEISLESAESALTPSSDSFFDKFEDGVLLSAEPVTDIEFTEYVKPLEIHTTDGVIDSVTITSPGFGWDERKLPTEIICYPDEPKLIPTEIVCWPTNIFDESKEIEDLIYADPIEEIKQFYAEHTIKLASYVIITDDVQVAVS